ncbi:egl nine homolog 1-like [Branchiostoma lanceolatum]|uniref:egl nine homolog 1-like n=1 Tax=Branchiostoma lanceolatum TaxID=7740 RepID=UPI003451949F
MAASNPEVTDVCAVCGAKSNLKRCSRCQGVMYCGREHQSQHWKQHKKICRAKLAARTDESDTQTADEKGHRSQSRGQPSSTADLLEREFDERPLNLIKPCQTWTKDLDDVAAHSAGKLRQDGFCVLDGLLDDDEIARILEDVRRVDGSGAMKSGELAGGRASSDDKEKVTKPTVRGDRIIWLQGSEPEYPNIGTLINFIDTLVGKFNPYFEGETVIKGRTKAQVACYPGNGAGYIRHVDNPGKDGRRITALFYLNKQWDVQTQGGNLRLFPGDKDQYLDITPLANRLLLFWSDRRNPHEVQPANDMRYAITVWYYDAVEREQARMDKVHEDMAKIRGDIALLELEVAKAEKERVASELDKKSKSAVEKLSDEELQAFACMVRGHPDPSAVLTEMGLITSIQELLLATLKDKGLL